MNKAIRSINKEKIKAIGLKKSEIKTRINKSILQNKNNTNLLRFYVNQKQNTNMYKYNISKQKKICFLTGRQRGVNKAFNLSRHKIKQYGLVNRLQNIKILTW